MGAYGATGRAVAAELLKSTEDGILLGCRDAAKLTTYAAGFGSRVSPVPVDILDSASLDGFCRECTIVINCAGPVTALQNRVAQAALRWYCHYVDPAGMSVVKERMLPHHQEIVDHGRPLVVSAGWTSGVTELLPNCCRFTRTCRRRNKWIPSTHWRLTSRTQANGQTAPCAMESPACAAWE